jgi:arylsulfatase A-like enzyme
MRRRTFLQGMGAGVAAGVAGCMHGNRAIPAKRPNIVYVFSDQHRWQSMAHTEMPTLETPSMTRMAREGMEFTQCISNNPLCSPHRGILMTGRWPFQQGVVENKFPLSPDEMTLGKAFRGAGYRTGYVGKWHLGGLDARPFGFEHSLIWEGSGHHWENANVYLQGEKKKMPRAYNATLMTDYALDYMEEQQEDPFFLMLSLNPPHPRWDDAPPDWVTHYKDHTRIPKRPNDSQPNDWFGWSECEHYYAHISAVDEELGRIMDRLQALSIADNTIVCYSSDHGEMLGSQGLLNKRLPYEESIRVPMLLWGGGMPIGEQVDALLGTVDVMPTLCGLAGFEAPSTCEGADFAPWVRGERGPDPDYQPIMHCRTNKPDKARPWRGLRTKTHTYVLTEEDNGLTPWLLHDNEADPNQVTNLIEDTGYASERKEWDGAIREWLAASNDRVQA